MSSGTTDPELIGELQATEPEPPDLTAPVPIPVPIDPSRPMWARVLILAWPVFVQQSLVLLVNIYDMFLAGNNQPADPSLGNGTLLFDIANRGRKVMLGTFNGAPASNDPTTLRELGDGFLMRDGYTLVWIGWQFDVAAPLLSIDAPRAERVVAYSVSATAPTCAGIDSPEARERKWMPLSTGSGCSTRPVRPPEWRPRP